MPLSQRIEKLLREVRSGLDQLGSTTDLNAKGMDVQRSLEEVEAGLVKAESNTTDAVDDFIERGGYGDLVDGNPTNLDGTLVGGNPAGDKARAVEGLDAMQANGEIEDWYLYSPGDGSRRWVVWGPKIMEEGLSASATGSATLTTAEVLALIDGNPTSLDGTLTGNPGEATLHSMLSDVSDHVDYEAEVVAAAADEIEDPEIAKAAKAQAAAMKDAADELDDAAEAARETAAEVFSETGTAQDDPQLDPDVEDVRDGNPTGRWKVLGVWPNATKPTIHVARTRDDAEAIASNWTRAGARVSIDGQPWEMVEGNPGEAPIPSVSEPPPDSGHVELVPEATVPAPPVPTPSAPDTNPEPAHWYTRPIGGRK